MNGQNRSAHQSAPAPALSVVMSLCDMDQPYTARQLDAAIRSIRAQSFADFEFLVGVDGADLGTARVIMGHSLDDRRIRLITIEACADAPEGTYTGLTVLNHLHEMARAPFIARADATDISAPNRLERQMAILAANPDHTVIGTGCARFAARDRGLVRRDPANPGAVFPPPANQEDAAPMGDDRIRAALKSGPPMDPATLIYARAAVLAVGGYRAAFGSAAGYDLLLRFSALTRMAKLPDALVSRAAPRPCAESEIVARASANAVAWLCHREARAGRVDPVDALGRLPTPTELDMLFGRGAGDVVRRRVIEASLHAPRALATQGWDMLQHYAQRHSDDPRMWPLAARMLAAGKPVRAGQLGMTLITA